MSSKKGGVQPYNGGVKSSPKGNIGTEVSNPEVDQVSHNVGDMSLENAQDSGWEVFTRKNKNKNKAGTSAARPGFPQNPTPKAWGQPDGQKAGLCNAASGKGQSNAWPAQAGDSKVSAGRGNARNPPLNNYRAPSAAIAPPLLRGWNWNARPASNLENAPGKTENINPSPLEDVKDASVDDEEYGSDEVDDSDDDLLSDDYDSDESQKSHETRKKNRWFATFFETLDKLTVEQINEPSRQWHCPACQNGPGSIDWYRGLQPLVTHAKTKGSKRMRLHRELAKLLDEELHRRGTSAVPAGEVFGKWKGLNEVAIDKEIVWPPMVLIMNTQLEKDDNDKWIGMGNQELMDYFHGYAAVKARHSYGPQGHRGMSVLIFEASAVGYLEAERLSKHFEDQGTHREAWDHRRVLFYPGGKRQLYGFMAEKGDLDLFNRHSPGKTKLKYDMRSYQESVVKQMKQMSEDNQQLSWFKNKVAKEQRHSRAVEESFSVLSQKLRRTEEENHIVRKRTMIHNQQNKEEMDAQEQFFKDQMKIIHEARGAKEDDFEKIQQEEREKMKQSYTNPASLEDPRRRVEGFEKFVKVQEKEMEEYVEEREKLLKLHEEKRVELKRKHWNEEVELEEEFDAALSQLMDKYTPNHEEKLPEETNSKDA